MASCASTTSQLFPGELLDIGHDRTSDQSSLQSSYNYRRKNVFHGLILKINKSFIWNGFSKVKKVSQSGKSRLHPAFLSDWQNPKEDVCVDSFIGGAYQIHNYRYTAVTILKFFFYSGVLKSVFGFGFFLKYIKINANYQLLDILFLFLVFSFCTFYLILIYNIRLNIDVPCRAA